MRRDKRGRVRFGHKGYRFELIRSGLKVYRRYGPDERIIYPGSWRGAAIDGLLRTEEGRAKLSDALTAVDQSLFTTAVHIPPNMRAVQ